VKIIKKQSDVSAYIQTIKHDKLKIGFVPTMGNLHAGHLNLIREARKNNDCVVVSIFVNPLQFSKNEDLDKYPKTIDQDISYLKQERCDVLFMPQYDDIYTENIDKQSIVHVPNITEKLCGKSRPGHFDGVTTIVCKLFNLIQPHCAYFGEKDFQQLATIKKMVIDLSFPIEIISMPTTRSEDSLALSSRNNYLNSSHRAIAPQLYQSLIQCKQDILSGSRDYLSLSHSYNIHLTELGFNVDYFEICEPVRLNQADKNDNALVILVAASLGNTRLIDNITLILNNSLNS
jgi:pantoate--beta-alanine ligase